MGIGISIFLVAVGAVLVWAVTGDLAGVDLNAIGWILLVVGAIGALLSLVFWSSLGGRRADRREERVIVDR